ncbi:unnamed protein product [Rotaria socialis]|uniref:Uncharacterized protein n=3 Tax=Rotaria socialis TaxID=392032 RepID=A0A817QS32_9BILA|nr:unnamed protein product [Rotaria socialis]
MWFIKNGNCTNMKLAEHAIVGIFHLLDMILFLKTVKPIKSLQILISINHLCCILVHTVMFYRMHLTIRAEDNSSTTNNPTAASTTFILDNQPAHATTHPTAVVFIHSSGDACDDSLIELSPRPISE